MLRRAAECAVLAGAFAVAEGAAAAAAGIDERAYFAAQAVVAAGIVVVLCAIPVPTRWMGVLLPVVSGGAHVVQVAQTAGFGTFGVALAATLHALILAAGLRECLSLARWANGSPERGAGVQGLAVLIAAVGAQSLACGALLVNRLQAPAGASLVWAFGCATLVPLLAAGAMTLALRTNAPILRKLAALAVFLVAVGLPLALRWPVLLSVHRRLPPPSAPGQADLPDVVLLVLDTTRADRLGAFGHARPTTPHLSALAERATLYTDAVSPAVWTLPGHASIFTGLYPSEHDSDHTQPLAREAVTLAEWFRAAGYRTGCFAANQMFRESASWGLTQGFETSWCELPPNSRIPLARFAFWALRQALPRLGGARSAVVAFCEPFIPSLRESQPQARDVIRPALRWLDAVGDDAPRLLFVNLMEAHGMQRVHDCGAQRFGSGRPIGPYQVAHVREVEAGQREADPADLERLRDSYDTAVACLDQHVGELLAGLEERGVLERAIVAVVADHGEMLGDQGAFGHRGEVWQGLVHVPLLLKLPGQSEGSVCSAPTDTAALAGVLPALAGLPRLERVPTWAGDASWVPGFVVARVLAANGEPIGANASASQQAPCPLPQRRMHQLSIAGPSIDAEHDLGPRYTRAWIALRDGTIKLFEDSGGARWSVDLSSPAGEVPLPPTPILSERFDVLLREWRAEEMQLAPGKAASPEEEAERMRVLQQLGYTRGG
jgi:arylsulfatase A-like enzyme